MWAIWPVVLVGIVLIVVLLLRGRGSTPNHNAAPTSENVGAEGTRAARELLDKRYARGEVSDEEYEEKRNG